MGTEYVGVVLLKFTVSEKNSISGRLFIYPCFDLYFHVSHAPSAIYEYVTVPA